MKTYEEIKNALMSHYSGRVMPREFIEKEAALKYAAQERNKAIDDVIGKLSIKVEFGYLEGLWEYIKSDLENLKV